jgi:drug/metabolite transporter (DMT)-like permease
LAALIVAVVPIWVVVLETWVFRVGKMPPRGLWGLALGIAGMLILLWPKIASGTHLGRLELFGAAILIFASLSWALGSILSHRWTLSVDVFTSAAWQMLLGGLVNTMIAAATGQFARATWTPTATWAIAYLVVSGSLIGFTAYIWLLEHVPPPKVATYAYVNPIVAVFLGWLLLREPVDIYTLAGAIIIIGSVALVNTAKLRRATTQPDLPETADVPAVAGD